MMLSAAEVKRRMLAMARALLIPARILREAYTLTNNYNRQVRQVFGRDEPKAKG